MYAEGGGWRAPREPAPRRPRLTRRQERIILRLVALNALLLLVAPIGGATIVQAVIALFGGG